MSKTEDLREATELSDDDLFEVTRGPSGSDTKDDRRKVTVKTVIGRTLDNPTFTGSADFSGIDNAGTVRSDLGAGDVYSSESALPAVTTGDNGTEARVLADGGVQRWEVVSGAWAFQEWLEGPKVDDVSALLADTGSYAEGTIIRTRAEGRAYRAVDTGGWQKTAGGQLLDPIPDLSAGFGPLANPTYEAYTPSASDPRVVTSFDGALYGSEGAIYEKTSRTGSWVEVAPNPSGGRAIHLVPMSDGEVIAVTGSTIEKSSGWGTGSVTWTTKVTNTGGTAVFLGYSTAGSDGVKMIVGEYGTGGAGSGWEDSQKAWATQDSGDTWSVAYDATVLHPSDYTDSHIHGCCYDAEMDLFFVIEGHTSSMGIYYNADPFTDATNWTRIENGPLGGGHDEGQPTNIVPTPNGIVCASDAPEQGLWVIRRADDPADLAVDWLWEAPWGRGGVLSFGQVHGIDAETGTVYFGFQFNSVSDIYAPLSIIASDGESAGVVWDGGPATAVTSSTGNVILNLAVAPWGEVIASTTSGSLVGQKKIQGDITRGFGLTKNLDPGNVLGGYGGGDVSVGRAVAVGQGAQATDANTVAVGMTAQAKAQFATAIGSKSRANFMQSTVLGAQAEATAIDGIAIGFDTKAGQRAINIGLGGDIGTGAIKIGSLQTISENGISIGDSCTLAGIRSIVIGQFAEASGRDSTAVGQSARALHVESVALGRGVETTRNYQVQLGRTHIELSTTPSNPPNGATDTVRIYTTQNGSGKQELRAVFPSGAAQVLAVEP